VAGAHAVHIYVDYDGAPQPLDQRPLKKADLLHLPQAIKEAVDIPVIGVGRIDPLSAEKALRDKKADLIAMGKALIADPDLPNKVQDGLIKSVRPCIVCLRCIDNVRTDKIIECTVNARVGHETEPSGAPASEPRKVMVIGGGPAGMEAARVAALRGHHVTLYDKFPRLGGLMLLGVILNPDLVELREYLIRELKLSPVRIELNREITQDILKKVAPEVLVVSTGGIPARTETSDGSTEIALNLSDILGLIKGQIPSVVNPTKSILWRLASWIFRYAYHPSLLETFMRINFPVGRRLVIIGGKFAGGELGLAYARKGKEVTIVEASADLLSDLGPTMKAIYLAKIKKHRINLLKEAQVLSITREGVRINLAGSTKLLEADSVVLAGGLKKGAPLIHKLQGYPGQVHLIGDCNEPARIKEAIAAGHHIGDNL
jgi:2,4-dienoyl-CoA reductase (NADPH2)